MLDSLTSAENSVKWNGPVILQSARKSSQRLHRRQRRMGGTDVLNVLAHARLRDPTTTKDLDSVSRDVLRGARDEHLQQRYRPGRKSTLSACSAP